MLEHEGTSGAGVGGPGSPCPRPRTVPCADGPARCIRAPRKQRDPGFLPTPLVLQSRPGPPGRWGSAASAAGAAGTGAGVGTGAPHQDHRAASQGGCRLSWGAAADPSVPGDRARGPRGVPWPGDGGSCVSAEPMLEARFIPSPRHRPSELQLPWSCHHLRVPAAPLAGVWGVPHPQELPALVLTPLASGAGGTGTCRLCLTEQSSILFSPHLPAAS